MIDFILSKFGIMLFAVSVAGIIILFTADMKNIFIADEGIQLSSVISKQISEMAQSDSICAFSYVTIPKYLDVVGGSNQVSSTSLFYSLDINVISPPNQDNKFVVFTLINKRNHKPFSLESFITNKEITLYSCDNRTNNNNNNFVEIDPTKCNVIFLVKAKQQNNTVSLYFIPCKYSREYGFSDCYDKVKKNFSQSDSAFCVPRDDPFKSKMVSD